MQRIRVCGGMRAVELRNGHVATASAACAAYRQNKVDLLILITHPFTVDLGRWDTVSGPVVASRAAV